MEVPAALSAELLRLIVCPQCRQPLEIARDGAALVSLRCTECGNNYPIVDGIPILIAGSAEAKPAAAQ